MLENKKQNTCSKNVLTFCNAKSIICLSEVMILKKMGMLKSQAIREAINALPLEENNK